MMPANPTIIAALQSHPLTKALGAEVLTELASHAHIGRVPAHGHIFSYGDADDRLLITLSGRAKIYLDSPEGKEVVLRLLMPGDVFGEFAVLDQGPRSANCTAEVETELASIQGALLLKLLHSKPESQLSIIQYLCGQLRQTNQLVEMLALLPLPQRLAKILLRLASLYGEPRPHIRKDAIIIGSMINQLLYGQLIATSRESVNRQLKSWEQQGLISLTPEGLVIYSLQEFGAIAGE